MFAGEQWTQHALDRWCERFTGLQQPFVGSEPEREVRRSGGYRVRLLWQRDLQCVPDCRGEQGSISTAANVRQLAKRQLADVQAARLRSLEAQRATLERRLRFNRHAGDLR